MRMHKRGKESDLLSEKNKQKLKKIGFTEAQIARRAKQPGWNVILRIDSRQLEEIISYAKRHLGEEGARILLGKLAHPKFQKEYKEKRGRAVPKPEELESAVLQAGEVAREWKLPEGLRGAFVLDNLTFFLLHRLPKAKILAAKKLLGKKYDFLRQHSFRESEILTLLRTPKGSEWLRSLDVRRFQGLKDVLSRYKLGSLFPVVLRADLHGRLRLKTARDLKEKIGRIFAIGVRYGVPQEKIKALLRRKPHLLIHPCKTFEGFLRLSLKLRPSITGQKRAKRRSPKPR